MQSPTLPTQQQQQQQEAPKKKPAASSGWGSISGIGEAKTEETAVPVDVATFAATGASPAGNNNFRRVLVAFVVSLIGVICAIAASASIWLDVGSNGNYKYYPFQLQYCDGNGCKVAPVSACDAIKRTGRGGNFCSLDDNLRGLVICAILFGLFASCMTFYLKRMGWAGTRMLYYVAAFFQFFAGLMAFSSLCVVGNMTQVEALSQGSNKATLSGGAFTQIITLALFTVAGGILCSMFKHVPYAVDPQAKAFAHANLFNFSNDKVQPQLQAPMQYGQPVYGQPQPGMYNQGYPPQQQQQQGIYPNTQTLPHDTNTMGYPQQQQTMGYPNQQQTMGYAQQPTSSPYAQPQPVGQMPTNQQPPHTPMPQRQQYAQPQYVQPQYVQP
ncbi:hypothetical protein HDU97_005920 [Phlyctochytrium planicorne]|nr:hypothetical protein HDU97_005920 [Phlyctochytrium planicorne]